MKRSSTWKLFLITLLMSFLTATCVFAQRQTGQGNDAPRYDPATEVTVTGVVQEVKQVSRPGARGGTHLTLDTDAGALDIHVGPSAFLEKRGFTFAKGDQIEVTGSKVKYEGADAVIAREIKKGDKTLTLRNAQGIPAWSGRKRWQ
jgi:DNA/RNA endonuclease YhcR with UshA esterase domain